MTTLAALIIEIGTGGMREVHWHPDADEWQYYMQGRAAMSAFDTTNKALTFDHAEDVGFVPETLGLYIKTRGRSPFSPSMSSPAGSAPTFP